MIKAKLSFGLILLLTLVPSVITAQVDKEDITFGKYRTIYSEVLGQERMLYVKLPENYESSEDAYPVVFQLYAHFLESYYLPVVRTTHLMAQMGEAPEMIVVGSMKKRLKYFTGCTSFIRRV
ncbi:MAG: hypothetical protein ISS19_01630 [Bacteroidales bacterium]|nr:hypothetical protein [Bacteroidales bacterium]